MLESMVRFEIIEYLKKLFPFSRRTGNSFESIKTATNNKFIDFHFSFKGHKQFAEYLENIINKKIL